MIDGGLHQEMGGEELTYVGFIENVGGHVVLHKPQKSRYVLYVSTARGRRGGRGGERGWGSTASGMTHNMMYM